MISRCIFSAILMFSAWALAADEYKTITIQNSYIKLDILPDSCGRISSIKFLPENLELMMPYKESTVSQDPLLPEIIESNGGGAKEWLWGKKPISRMAMADIKVKEDKNSGTKTVSMYSRYYMSENVSLFKTVEISKGNCFFSARLKIKNIDKQSAEIALWENLIPLIGKKSGDSVIIPAAGNVKEAGGKTMHLLSDDALVTETSSSELKEDYFAPARGWIARFSKEQNLVFAIRTKMENLKPDGFFYRWKNDDGSIFTQEIIFSKVSLAPEEEKEYVIDYII